ncbi:hypothetical protein DL98DRAFT_565669 [Cadophora sp. DSE1049]|nr:hypothetical protein DL98DRAFT_565669 [Cadophora sp. DSE1049]
MNNVTVKQEHPEIKSEKFGEREFSSQPPPPCRSWNKSDCDEINSVNAPKEMPSTVTAPTGPTVAFTVGMTASGVLQSGDQSVQMSDLDLYASSPANSWRPETRNNLKRTIDYKEREWDDYYDEDDEDDDEGGPIRSSQERAKRQKRIAQPLPAEPPESSDIKVGHHTAEPLITIFAKFRKVSSGSPTLHIYTRKPKGLRAVFQSGKSWSDHVHKNGQVHTDDVTLDPGLIPGDEDGAENLTYDQKRLFITQYLSSIENEELPSHVIEAPTPSLETQEDTPTYEHGTPIIVGFHKDFPAVPVRAQLRLQSSQRVAAVLFRLDAEDVKKSKIILPKLSVNDTQVKFIPEFARPTIEETKAEIRSRFCVEDNEHENEEMSVTTSQHSPHRKQSIHRKSGARLGKEETRRLSIELPTGSADGIDKSLRSLQDLGQHFLTAAFEYGEELKKRESVVLETEGSLFERERLVERREEATEEEISTALMEKELSIEGLREQVEQIEKAKTEDNARLQEVIDQLRQQNKQLQSQNHEQARNPQYDNQFPQTVRSPESASPLSLNLNGLTFAQAYEVIEPDEPNAGCFWERRSETVTFDDGPMQGKRFERNRVLQPIQGLIVPGDLSDIGVHCSENRYLHYDDHGTAKLVQAMKSFVQHEVQYYVCSVYLKEIKGRRF